MFFSDDSQSAFKTDITDEGDAYRLEADLPGFDKKDIHVDINGDRMTVSAQRHSDYEEKDKRQVHSLGAFLWYLQPQLRCKRCRY